MANPKIKDKAGNSFELMMNLKQNLGGYPVKVNGKIMGSGASLRLKSGVATLVNKLNNSYSFINGGWKKGGTQAIIKPAGTSSVVTGTGGTFPIMSNVDSDGEPMPAEKKASLRNYILIGGGFLVLGAYVMRKKLKKIFKF